MGNRDAEQSYIGVGTSCLDGGVLSDPGGDAIDIALVNNTPDQALRATEVQFSKVLRAGMGELPVRLRLYSLPGITRGETMRRYVADYYKEFETLFSCRVDALIVTGTEPRAKLLNEEPYWEELTHLINWARTNTISSLWSCLAAHAAVQHLDGVMRRPTGEKCSGVFSIATAVDDPIVTGAPPSILVPHSRYNTLDESELVRCGYTISSRSDATGVDMFWRREPSLFLFLQGHLEYEVDTLSHEYRRDVIRYLSKARDSYPRIPANYFSVQIEEKLAALGSQIRAEEQPGHEAELDEILSQEAFSPRWTGYAALIYRNWLRRVAAEKHRGVRWRVTK